MFALVYANREGADIRVQIGLLSLMCTWLYESPDAVKEFLTEGSNVQFVSSGGFGFSYQHSDFDRYFSLPLLEAGGTNQPIERGRSVGAGTGGISVRTGL